ncbi:MAG: hypothetical protein U0L18_09660 [Acutalibacteraceae bacterium]|nr:hypothetical protein [Acutalibacteraceae bacterium]
MGDKFVSEVLSYEKDIKPYKFIRINAGVGSGKNTFIENFIKGEHNTPKKTVLLITSRRAKVDETINSIDIENGSALSKWKKKHKILNINNEKYDNKAEYKIIPSLDNKTKWCVKQESVVCTNAFIEFYFKKGFVKKSV